MRPRSSALFEKFHADHGSAVLRLVWSLGVPQAERDDIAQEVWLTVARHLDSYEDRNPHAWLGTITRNAVRTWRRTRRRRPEFSAQVDEGTEPIDLRTPETATEDERRWHAVRAFLYDSIPNEERREAFILHCVFGQTVAEVAETMAVPLETAQARLKMARRDIERARRALSDEERAKLRAYVLPFASVEAMMEDLRSSVSEDEAAKVRERVRERIEAEENGGEALSTPPPAPSPEAPTTPIITSGMVKAFVVGVLVGAGSLYLPLSRNPQPPASVVTFEAPAPSIETPPERVAEPESMESARPLSTAAPRTDSAADTGSTWEADSLLSRARRAVRTDPGEALGMVKEHAEKYPKRDRAKREEIEIRALVQLGQRNEAEARAAQLVTWAPSKRAAMADLFDRPFP